MMNPATFLADKANALVHHPRFPVYRRIRWSIAMYTGRSPLDLQPADGVPCPALTGDDVTDVQADFVADPFMLEQGGTWHMFFEVLNHQTRRGEIGLALSRDALHWSYKQIVLREPFHLSYPYVFSWDGGFYMVPESYQANAVRLYEAAEFPTRWEHACDLIEGAFVDSSLFRFNGAWWMFTSQKAGGALRLYHAERLHGPWEEHPSSPICAGPVKTARPGGRVVVLDNAVIRFAQDERRHYGGAVRAYRVERLTPTDYAETQVEGGPVLAASGHGWNARGMHHVDACPLGNGQWIACVDGCRRTVHLGAHR